MNSLKTVLVVVVLAVVAGAVYMMINRNPASPPPPELTDGWSSPPSVELPDAATAGAPFAPPFDAGMGSAGGMAPPFSPEQPASQASSRGMSPPFSPSASPEGTAARPPVSGATSEAPFPPGDTLDPNSQPAEARSAQVREAFATFMEAAHRDLQAGKLAEVHEKLSMLYDSPQLTAEQHQQLTDLLDQVAGAVVYSRQPLLEPAYTVKAGDTLETIADEYNVPWQLLAKINGIPDPQSLQPGQQLKVVRGPFDAVVDLDKHELTLTLGGLYAGRFPIGVGRGQANLEGEYFVQKKLVQPDDPNNPLGRYWIQLDDRIGIHGTNDPRNIGTNDGPGTISLSGQDIEDVHDILSIGSRVRILR
jgi:lipoprotein-anchoring transpeptidase ErfK/SrfK